MEYWHRKGGARKGAQGRVKGPQPPNPAGQVTINPGDDGVVPVPIRTIVTRNTNMLNSTTDRARERGLARARERMRRAGCEQPNLALSVTLRCIFDIPISQVPRAARQTGTCFGLIDKITELLDAYP